MLHDFEEDGYMSPSQKEVYRSVIEAIEDMSAAELFDRLLKYYGNDILNDEEWLFDNGLIIEYRDDEDDLDEYKSKFDDEEDLNEQTSAEKFEDVTYDIDDLDVNEDPSDQRAYDDFEMRLLDFMELRGNEIEFDDDECLSLDNVDITSLVAEHGLVWLVSDEGEKVAEIQELDYGDLKTFQEIMEDYMKTHADDEE